MRYINRLFTYLLTYLALSNARPGFVTRVVQSAVFFCFQSTDVVQLSI